MDDGTIGNVMDAIETALKVTMADFDFAPTGRVLRGRYAKPPKVPFIGIATPSTRSQQGPPLGNYENSPTIDILAWAPAPSSTSDERSRVGLALLHQVKKALDTARKTSTTALYSLREFAVETVNMDSDGDPVPPGMCLAAVVVTLKYVTSEGL